VKHRHGLSILAVLLLTSVPAVADRIPSDFTVGDRGSVRTQWLSNERTSQDQSAYWSFSASTLTLDEFHNEFNRSR
jgi:hypothetical protein